jgi:hypothetical protein
MYFTLDGVPSSSAFYSARHGGFTAGGWAGVEASVALQALRLGGALSGGAVAPGPVGDVSGEAAVRLDGTWAGGEIFAGLLF